MPLRSANTQVEFRVSGTGTACPEGSECIDALRCVEMGGRCIEGTHRCGGRAQNCCCTFRKPVAEGALPVLVAVGAVALIVAGIVYGLRKLGRTRR
jgi:hypothetical protein